MTKPIQQKVMAKWIVILGILFSSIAYLLKAIQFGNGLLFGAVLCAVNYYIIDALLGYIISVSTDTVAKALGFAGYHVRFWVLVVILFFVITRNESQFTVGFFISMLLAKTVMGAMVIANTGEEWWNKRY